jgi:hypothetical protein
MARAMMMSRFYLDEVLDEFVEDGGDIVESIEALEEPASEGALDAREGVAAVDEVACADVGIEDSLAAWTARALRLSQRIFAPKSCCAASQDMPDSAPGPDGA